MEGGITKRITNTPWQERSVGFSPDGRSLVYAAERDGSWNVYTTTISRQEEPYFFASTVLDGEAGGGHGRPRSTSPPSRPTARRWRTSRTAWCSRS